MASIRTIKILSGFSLSLCLLKPLHSPLLNSLKPLFFNPYALFFLTQFGVFCVCWIESWSVLVCSCCAEGDMELQLGLAPPSHPAKGFDLNRGAYEPIRATDYSNPIFSGGHDDVKKRRCFDEAFEEEREAPETLPLLLWNNQANDEDDHPSFLEKNPSPINRNDEDCIVGWPPIKSSRKKLCDQNGGCWRERRQAATNGWTGDRGRGGGGSNSNMYVKVKMEGVGITRKVDLSLHNSYQTLALTLMSMFGKRAGEVGEYKLAYQDREGDWLLAGDLPWRNFTPSVQRLKLLRCHG